MPRPEIVITGSHAPALFIHTNRIPLVGETVNGWDYEEPRDGGKGSNQAIAAARLGANVAFIGMVGNDRLGNNLFDWFKEEKVDSKWLHRHEILPTGVGFNIQNKDGDCALVTSMGANEGLTKEFIDAALADLSQARIFLTQFEIPPKIALYAARSASNYGSITILNPAPAVEGGLSYEGVSILVPNEIEAKIIAGVHLDQEIDSFDLLMLVKQKSGVPTIIITLGEAGIFGIQDCDIWQEKPPEVKVVDASGAGDQFCAALAVGLNDGMDIKAACKYAIKAASLSVTRKGTISAFVYMKEIS
jgi:ribokinase